jgi:WD40 repeat protein
MNIPPGLDRIIRYRSPATLPHLDQTGRLLAVPGQDGTVTVYDLTTGAVRTLTSSTPREFAVFSGDDRLVAAGGSDGSVVIWDASTGVQSGKELQVGGGVVHPVFDPRDDDRLYVIDSRGALSEWDRSDPEHPHRVRYFYGFHAGGPITEAPDLTISPDGQRLAAGDIEMGYTSGAPSVWDTRSRKVVDDLFGSIGSFAADGHTLPLGFGDKTVLADARTGRIENTVPDTGGSALAVVSPDGDRLAVSQSVHGARVVSVYNLRTHRRIGQPLTLQDVLSDPVGFLPDGRLVTTGTDDAAVWSVGIDVAPLGVRLDTSNDRSVTPGNGSETPSFLSRSGTVLVLGGSNTAVVHDPASGRARTPILSGAVRGPVVASPDGRLLVGQRATAGGFGIWDLRSGRLLSILPGATTRQWGGPPVWSPSGDLIVINFSGVLDMWHVADPRHPSGPERIAGQLGTDGEVAFTPDSREMVVETTHNTISLVDVGTGRIDWTRTVREGALAGDFALSPGGATIASSYFVGDTGHLQFLDTATGTPRTGAVLSTTGGFGYVYGGRWLIGSQYLATQQAQLYDAATLEPIGAPFPTGTVPAGIAPSGPIAVNGSGTMFAETTRLDPTLWHVDPDSWLKVACDIAGRNLTSAEWQHYLPHRAYQRTCPQYPGP